MGLRDRRDAMRRTARARVLGAMLACVVAIGAAARVAAEDPAPAVEVAEQESTAAIATLRAARVALERGETDRAVALFAAVEERHPIVSDHAALLAAQSLLDAKRYEESMAVVVRFQARGIPTPLASDLERVRGGAALGMGKSDVAEAALSHALAGTETPARVAPLLLLLAQLEERRGDAALAAERWLRLWRDLPTQPEARGSGEKLEDLGRVLGRNLRSPEDAATRGDRLFDAGLRESSLDAYDRAVAGGLAGPRRKQVERRRGEALFGLRRYDEAARTFAQLGDDPEAEVFHARSVARSGDVEGAVTMLLAQAQKRPGPDGASARWYAALLLDGEDQRERAEPLFADVAREAADPSLRANARWRLGWAAWRAGRIDAARAHFAEMETAAPDAIPKLQARYWQARAAEKGEQGNAAALHAAIVREAPFTYYGFRSREWLAKRGALPKPTTPPAAIASGDRALSARDAMRARILVGAELGAVATEEIDRLAARAQGVDDAVLVATLYRDAGAYDLGQRLVTRRYGDALPQGPPPGQEGIWQAAWPLAFADAVKRGTASTPRLRPPLVLALMREESSFRPSVRSPAGAIGLMQLMPATAARVANDVGLAGFETGMLTDPRVNVRLGTAYLDGLLGRFDGRASAAIGSYNAGPEPVARWLAERPGQADDEWVESVPYEETRNYIKRVLRSLHVYRELYAHEG